MNKWIEEQIEGSSKVIIEDHFLCPIKYIGGLDISFVDQSDNVTEYEAVGALVILDFNSLSVLYSDCIEMTTKIPYIPGFLGFREEPFAQALFERLYEKAPELVPQILLVDGCGIYHPRKFGSASQIGVNLNIPTIGVSKSFLKLDGLDENDFVISSSDVSKAFELPVVVDSNFQIATALYTGKSKHPCCFVSIGNRVSLPSAVEIVKKCSISKIPEPIRQADLISRDYIRQIKVE